MTMLRIATILGLGAVLAGCATTARMPTDTEVDARLSRMMALQSEMQGAELEAALADAAQYPLGSKQNPVRAGGARGQRAYLARLRCEDLTAPTFGRIGSAGMSPYGNIVDRYWVKCEGSEPAESTVFIDMYHSGYVEEAAVPGYGITGGQTVRD